MQVNRFGPQCIGRLAGERLTPLALIGGLCVVSGVIVSEWRPKWFKETLISASSIRSKKRLSTVAFLMPSFYAKKF